MNHSIGFLIENGKTGADRRYRDMKQGIPVWTSDVDEAMRFCRRIDAEKFAEEDEDAWSITQHMWIDEGSSGERETVKRTCKNILIMLVLMWLAFLAIQGEVFVIMKILLAAHISP